MNELSPGKIDVVILINFEKKLNKGMITSDDAAIIIDIAKEKCYPRAEYLASCMYLIGCGVAKNIEIGLEYLEKSSKHAGYSLQLKIAEIYHKLGNYRNVKRCLESALHDYEFQEWN